MGKLNIICGNILDHLDNKDLVVNSANKYMTYGSGVCGAIYKKANKDLLEEYCKNNFLDNMKVNEVRITPGFDLGIDILHIYCPKAHENSNSISDLIDSYIYIFINAKEKECKSIVSVSIGTGVHGYKHSDVANNVVSILNDLVYRFDIDFTLVLPNEEVMKLYADIKPLTLEEFKELSDKEKGKRYIELSPKDKYIVRLTDVPKATTIENTNISQEQKEINEKKMRDIKEKIRKNSR